MSLNIWWLERGDWAGHWAQVGGDPDQEIHSSLSASASLVRDESYLFKNPPNILPQPIHQYRYFPLFTTNNLLISESYANNTFVPEMKDTLEKLANILSCPVVERMNWCKHSIARSCRRILCLNSIQFKCVEQYIQFPTSNGSISGKCHSSVMTVIRAP